MVAGELGVGECALGRGLEESGGGREGGREKESLLHSVVITAVLVLPKFEGVKL